MKKITLILLSLSARALSAAPAAQKAAPKAAAPKTPAPQKEEEAKEQHSAEALSSLMEEKSVSGKEAEKPAPAAAEKLSEADRKLNDILGNRK